jgi:hypothetical protein
MILFTRNVEVEVGIRHLPPKFAEFDPFSIQGYSPDAWWMSLISHWKIEFRVVYQLNPFEGLRPSDPPLRLNGECQMEQELHVNRLCDTLRPWQQTADRGATCSYSVEASEESQGLRYDWNARSSRIHPHSSAEFHSRGLYDRHLSAPYYSHAAIIECYGLSQQSRW